MNHAIVIFAKVPGTGRPKMRIASEAGRPRANAIYEELLRATARIVGGRVHFVSYTGGSDPGGLRSFFSRARGFIPQDELPMGQRMETALLEVRKKGYDALCALGTDCPYVEGRDLDKAFMLLERGRDLVIGPAEDGGYYLIALKEPACGVFSVEGFGGSTLLGETLAWVAEKERLCDLLDSRRDIDTLEDYKVWKDSLGEEAH